MWELTLKALRAEKDNICNTAWFLICVILFSLEAEETELSLVFIPWSYLLWSSN